MTQLICHFGLLPNQPTYTICSRPRSKVIVKRASINMVYYISMGYFLTVCINPCPLLYLGVPSLYITPLGKAPGTYRNLQGLLVRRGP